MNEWLVLYLCKVKAYSLAFGTKVVVLVEIGMPSYWVQHFQPEQNEKQLKFNLDLLEEKI